MLHNLTSSRSGVGEYRGMARARARERETGSDGIEATNERAKDDRAEQKQKQNRGVAAATPTARMTELL